MNKPGIAIIFTCFNRKEKTLACMKSNYTEANKAKYKKSHEIVSWLFYFAVYSMYARGQTAMHLPQEPAVSTFSSSITVSTPPT